MSNMPRPKTLTPLGVDIPVVRNMKEAREICGEYDAVLTVGPNPSEVRDFCHPKHKVVTFDDMLYEGMPNSPTYAKVIDAVKFGIGIPKLLVHCHAGISRSTAAAWGVAIGNGIDPYEAFKILESIHPIHDGQWTGKRPFAPNDLMVQYIDEYFGLGGQMTKILIKNGRGF